MLRYLFVDMNSYFASVEQQDRPDLRGRPIGVIPTDAQATCCIAASYEAKAYGITTGIGVRQAKHLCPHIVLVIARPQRYVEYHHRIINAIESCLHVDRVCSIDEMYGRLIGDECRPQNAAVIAHQVKNSIRNIGETLRCSIGLAPNVWLAKIATDVVKPDGLMMILPEQLPEALHRFQLDELPGIAMGMLSRLHHHGVDTVAQLCRLTEREICDIWASKVWGAIWYQQLRGRDLPYHPIRRRTVGHSHVLPPKLRTNRLARGVMVRMIHKAAQRIRRLGYSTGRLDVSVKHMNRPGWHRWALIVPPVRDTLSILRTFEPLWAGKSIDTPLQVGCVLSNLEADVNTTMPLYQEQQRLNNLADVMDRIDARHGRHTVYFGSMFGHQNSAPTRIAFTQIPGVNEFDNQGLI